MKYPTIMQKNKKFYSEWTTPKANYRLACCDCSLIHDFEFGVWDRRTHKRLDMRKLQIQFRVRRNARATSAMRRHWKS